MSRAATKLETGGIPAEWLAGVTRLRGMECPAAVPVKRWTVLCADAVAFVRDWGETADLAGRSTGDLFGCDPVAPAGRLDRQGAVWSLNGFAAVDITPSTITARSASGALLRIFRRPGPDRRRVLAWELPMMRVSGGSDGAEA